MRIKITAGGIYDGEGKEIPVGTELEVADQDGDAQHPWTGRFEVISADRKGKTIVVNDDPPPPPPPADFVAPVGPFTAKDAGSGWWAIFDGKDQQVGKKARKADLDGFDTLSDEDKLEFATQHAKAAFDAEQKKA